MDVAWVGVVRLTKPRKNRWKAKGARAGAAILRGPEAGLDLWAGPTGEGPI